MLRAWDHIDKTIFNVVIKYLQLKNIKGGENVQNFSGN